MLGRQSEKEFYGKKYSPGRLGTGCHWRASSRCRHRHVPHDGRNDGWDENAKLLSKAPDVRALASAVSSDFLLAGLLGGCATGASTSGYMGGMGAMGGGQMDMQAMCEMHKKMMA